MRRLFHHPHLVNFLPHPPRPALHLVHPPGDRACVDMLHQHPSGEEFWPPRHWQGAVAGVERAHLPRCPARSMRHLLQQALSSQRAHHLPGSSGSQRVPLRGWTPSLLELMALRVPVVLASGGGPGIGRWSWGLPTHLVSSLFFPGPSSLLSRTPEPDFSRPPGQGPPVPKLLALSSPSERRTPAPSSASPGGPEKSVRPCDHVQDTSPTPTCIPRRKLQRDRQTSSGYQPA